MYEYIMQSRIIYSSKTKRVMLKSELKELAATSVSKNKVSGITGFLVYSNEHFLQYLEGEASILQKLLNKIHNDPRHEILDEVTLQESEEKVFPEWAMESILPEDLSGEITKARKIFIIDCWAMVLDEKLLWE